MLQFISENPWVIAVAVGVLFLFIFLLAGYEKAPSDKVFIISGLRKKPKILIGKAGIRIPFFERKDILIAKQISVDIKTNGYIPTLDFIGVDVDAIAKIALDIESLEGIALAQKNFLNMDEHQIREALTDSLQGNMREIIGTINLKEICNNRQKFGDQVQEKAQRDMSALGVKIISCNIQRIIDENELINALGQDNMSKIQKEASIAKAEADRDVAIAQAEAKKLANDAEVNAKTEIAIKQNELSIKEAELQKISDAKKAEAAAAYRIQEEEQRKVLEITATNADIAKQEREVELKAKEAEVKEQELAATIRKQAEAEKYRIEQNAQADLFKRQKEAEAKKYEDTQRAEAEKVKAEAAKYAKEQEAAGIAAIGRAEAEAIKQKGIAEAEALERKADAMAKYGRAAILEMIVNTLPEMAAAIAKPLESIDKVTIIDGGSAGNGSGVSSMGGYVPAVLAKTIESVKETTGIDINEIIKADTYDAKVNKNLNVTGIDNDVNVKVDSQAE
ncbi:MAG: SPFH domain-containing protein [Lachnospiraceae bacterium]|nr:SPFH domain-containing protein [Lachnospiraceae bacterium]